MPWQENDRLSIAGAARPVAYSGSPRAVLCRGLASFAIAIVALASGGCSTSYQLGAISGKDGKADRTDSVAPRLVPAKFDSVAERDLVFAKAAAADLFARGAKDVSVTWENPHTGARGAVTPIATAREQDGLQCQDFLASYVRGDGEAWYQGGACREGGAWKVRDLRPLQRT